MDWKKLGYYVSKTPDLPFGYEALIPTEQITLDCLVHFANGKWNSAAAFTGIGVAVAVPSCRPIQAPTNWLRHGYDADWLTADVVPSGYLPATAGLVLPAATNIWRWNTPQRQWVLDVFFVDYQIDTSYAPVCVPANFYSSSVAAATVAVPAFPKKIVPTATPITTTYPNPMLGPGAMAWGYNKEWPDAIATIPVWAELVGTPGVGAKIEIGDIYWDLGFMAWIQARSSVFGMSIQGQDPPVARSIHLSNKAVTPSAPAVWHCSKSPRCIQRENDVGYGCYLCGAKQT